MNDSSYNNWNSMNDDRIVHQIGEFIKRHRIEQNKSQAMLAKDAGISRSTLSLLERGGTTNIATLIQVLRVLDQLQVLNGIATSAPPSPLLLAKVEKKKRQRATSHKVNKQNANEDIGW